MKLGLYLLALAEGSHFRGGTYQFTPNGNKLIIGNTQTWRSTASGYAPQCTKDDVINQKPASEISGFIWRKQDAKCSLLKGRSRKKSKDCQDQTQSYTVSFADQDYCYGDGVNQIERPKGPFSYGWESCCWVPLTNDRAEPASVQSKKMRVFGSIFDLDNTSPSFKHPPLWLIMAGCDGQKIDLAPEDADGDVIKCRWATQQEAGGAWTDPVEWPSFLLDEENCIVHYFGSLDASQVGVKPVGLMMEDFDSNGNVKSSIPVQFLAQVWTPDMNSRSVSPNYPILEWYPPHDHSEHEHVRSVSNRFEVARGRRNSPPDYCTAVPFFKGATPQDGTVLDGTNGSVNFKLEAESQIGTIFKFDYQSPMGMTSSDLVTVNQDGSINCSWTLTPDQLSVEFHGFCFTATDSVGLTTERRCIVIKGKNPPPPTTTTTTTSTTTTTTTTTTSTTTTSTTTTSTTTTSTTTTSTTTTSTTTTSTTTTSTTTTSTTTTTTTTKKPERFITDIHEMAAEFLNGPKGFFVSNATDYGCAGRGHFDFKSKTFGKLVDDADRAFYTWKKCIQCTGIGALPQFQNQLPRYRFRKQECGKCLSNILNGKCLTKIFRTVHRFEQANLRM